MTGLVAKEKLLHDIQFRGAISDFHPLKAKLTEVDYDPVMFRLNNDDLFGDGNNFEVGGPGFPVFGSRVFGSRVFGSRVSGSRV